MMPKEFDADRWIERLAAALPALAEAQEPYLQDYWREYPRTHRIVDGRDETPFPLDDLRILYEWSRYSRRLGEEAYYASLRTALDTVRHSLVAHPTLERVAVTGRIIGDNDFSMAILNSEGSVSAGVLVAGLMARAAELSGDRFRAAARDLNAFLSPARDGEAVGEAGGEAGGVLGNLDEGCDAMLFYGLAVTERIEVREGMAILPYGELLRFVDEKFVEELAPRGAGFHGWRSAGAIVRPFRWRPAFRRRGSVNEPIPARPDAFFPDAATFLDLLAVSHAVPVVPLAALSDEIDRSARRLLGRAEWSPGIYQSWPAQGFDGFAGCPALSPEALREAREVFENRGSPRYRSLAPIVGRLAVALARDGRFALHDKIVDVSIALEGMYDLPRGGVTSALEERVSGFLGTDAGSRDRIGKSARAFYDARSAIVHSRSARASPFTNGAAFVTGFDLARRSLFKLLREGAPGDWNKLAAAGD